MKKNVKTVMPRKSYKNITLRKVLQRSEIREFDTIKPIPGFSVHDNGINMCGGKLAALFCDTSYSYIIEIPHA